MPRGVAPYILVMDTSADGLKAAAPRTKPACAGWVEWYCMRNKEPQ